MKLDKLTLVAALLTFSAAAQAPRVIPIALETTPKRAGTVRIGLAEPEAAQLSRSVRIWLIEHLSTPGVDVLPIRSSVPQVVEAEASSKDCDFILYTSLHGLGAESNFAYKLYAAGGGVPVAANTYQVRANAVWDGGAEAAVPPISSVSISTALVQQASEEVLGAVTSRGHYGDANIGTGTGYRWSQPFGVASSRD
jgi:hypothetical protein